MLTLSMQALIDVSISASSEDKWFIRVNLTEVTSQDSFAKNYNEIKIYDEIQCRVQESTSPSRSLALILSPSCGSSLLGFCGQSRSLVCVSFTNWKSSGNWKTWRYNYLLNIVKHVIHETFRSFTLHFMKKFIF